MSDDEVDASVPEEIIASSQRIRKAMEGLDDCFSNISYCTEQIYEEQREKQKEMFDFVSKENEATLKEILSLFQTNISDLNKFEKDLLDVYSHQISSVLNHYAKKYEGFEREQNEKMKGRKKKTINLSKFAETEAYRLRDVGNLFRFAVFEELKYHMNSANLLSKLFTNIYNMEALADLEDFAVSQNFEPDWKKLNIDMEQIKQKKEEFNEKKRNLFNDSHEEYNLDDHTVAADEIASRTDKDYSFNKSKSRKKKLDSSEQY